MRTDSHAATLALLVCLLFANGCASVLNWDRQGEIDVVETPDQPPPMLEEVVENSARKPLALRRDDPPPPPDGILDDQPERRVAKPAEFVDQLRGDNALTAEEQKAIETLKQKSPAAAEFLASRAGDPTQRNLAQLHSETVAKPPAGESQGIDLLREGSTMPPPSLGTPGAATSPAESYPSQARLGTPGPLNEPQGSRAIALQANPAQPQLPIVEYGQPPAQGNSAPLVGDQRMPPRTDVTSPQGGLSPDPRFASNDPQSIRMPNVQHGNPSSQGGLGPQAYTDPRQATYDRNQPLPHHPTQPLGSQSNPYTASQGGQRDPQVARSPNGTAPAAGSPQMIINKHVEQRGGQPQEGVVQASFNGGYQSTQTPNGPQADRNAEPIHWRQHLEHAIAALEEELNQAHVARDSYGKAPAEGEEANAPRRLLPLQQQEIAELEAQLRMLYLSAGMREAAVAPVEYYEPSQQEFYKYAMNGLSVYLDREKHPVDERRLKLALRDMRQAVAELSTASSLDVRNLAFCSRVDSFGSFEEFPEFQFTAGQEVLLYVEVENFATEKGLDGYETALLGSYRVFDVRKNRVADHTFIEEVEVCRNRRRDYFITYRMWIPKDVDPGQYTLQLTVEDLKGNKSGQASIRFEVR